MALKETSEKIRGLESELDYYKWAYNSKCEQVDSLLEERKELLGKVEELQNTLITLKFKEI